MNEPITGSYPAKRKTFEIIVMENGLYQLSISGNTSFTAYLLTADLLGELQEQLDSVLEKEILSVTKNSPQNGQEHL